MAQQQAEVKSRAHDELQRHKSAIDAQAAAGAADLQEQRAAAAAVRAAVTEQARALDKEAANLALQRAELERQLETFRAQVCVGPVCESMQGTCHWGILLGVAQTAGSVAGMQLSVWRKVTLHVWGRSKGCLCDV